METKLLSKIKTKTSIGLIHRLYITQLKNKYIHTASTKTKSEVRGGGRKPWKQKGTGNARAGSIRSPLWAGGGVIFGPRPHLVSKKINKKEKRLAILSAFYLKNKETQLILNDTRINESIFKTKDLINYLNELQIKNSLILNNQIKNEKILFILEKSSKSFWLATRNLKNITITTAKCLNVSDLLHAQHIFLSNLSLKIIQETYGKLYI